MNPRSAPIAPDLFSNSRKKLQLGMEHGTWAIAGTNPMAHRNGDVNYPYRQDSDFFYLSGIGQEGCVLLLSAEEETLFIPQDDPKNQLWNGRLLDREQASALSGIKDVRSLEELEAYFSTKVAGARDLRVHLPGNEGPVQRLLEQHCPNLERQPLSASLAPLRMIKEPEEIEAIQKACKVTGEAFRKILGCLEPGLPEYGLEAELTSAFIAAGSNGHAYEPIIASGENALVLHYIANSDLCVEGELVLLDFGAEWNNYASDCSRTLPVNGRFSKRQLELYRCTQDVFEEARSLMVPGTILADFQKQVGQLWEEAHIRLGLYSAREAREADPANPPWRKYFMHGISHSMGLDVHDPFDREKAFEEGMVLTCEPGIYIEEEQVGIRLENDILIGREGPVDLMADIPMDPEEIETLMHEQR